MNTTQTYRHETAQADALDALGAARASGRLAYGPNYGRDVAEAYADLARLVDHNDRAPHAANARAMSVLLARLVAYLGDDREARWECNVGAAASAHRERWGV